MQAEVSVIIQQSFECDAALTSNPNAPFEDRREALFEKIGREPESRIGCEGYWIIPALVFSLAIIFGLVKLSLWCAATVIGW